MVAINKKILGSIDRRFIGNNIVECSIGYFSNFPINDIISVIGKLNGVNEVIDYKTSYHIDIILDTKLIDYEHRVTTINNLFKELYGIIPQYI